MSNITEAKAVIDSRLDVSAEYESHIELIPANVQYVLNTADGSSNSSQLTFSQIVVPSQSNTVVSRDARILATITVTVPNAATDPAQLRLPLANYDPTYQQNACLVSSPLSTCASNVNLQINGNSTSVPMAQVYGGISRLYSREALERCGSEQPAMLDDRNVLLSDATPYAYFPAVVAYPGAVDAVVSMQTASGLVTVGHIALPAAYPAAGTVIGVTASIGAISATNPVIGGHTALAAWPTLTGTLLKCCMYNLPAPLSSCNTMSKFENAHGKATRGAFKPFSSDVVGLNRVFVFNISEAVQISPFTPFENYSDGLANINTLSLTYVFNNLLGMIYSNVPFTSTGLTVALSKPYLQLTYLQTTNEVQIPASVSYDFTSLANYFPKSYPATNLNVTATISTDQIRLVNQPKCLMFFVRTPQTQRVITNPGTGVTVTKTDTMIPLGSDNQGTAMFQLQIGTRNVFSSASLQDLYRVSNKNGLDVSWEQFAYGGSCIIVLKPEDFGLSIEQGDVLPGMLGNASNNNVQITCSVNSQSMAYAPDVNINIGAVDLEAILIPLYSGECIITPSDSMFNLGMLSQAQAKAVLADGAKEGFINAKEIPEGGSLFSAAKKLFGKGAIGSRLLHKGAEALLGKLKSHSEGGVLSAGSLKMRRK